jgi:hypothetical protein
MQAQNIGKDRAVEQAIRRREFLQATVGGTLVCLHGSRVLAFGGEREASRLVSAGCRRSKVKVARIYMGVPRAHYPNPAIDLGAEMARYQAEFAKLKEELSDVDFVVDELVGSAEQVKSLKDRLEGVDGILAIHLTLWTMPVMKELLALGIPTMIFAVPYSGHEWYDLSAIRRDKLGERLECLLTKDYKQLAVAIRPFRAIHHLREAKVLNLATASPAEYHAEVKAKFGTEIKLVTRERVLDLYNSVSDPDVRAEAGRWTKNAVAIVEPSAEEILKSSRLALAFQKLLDEEDGTVLTADCYGSMYHQLPAYPCIGFTRLNDLGFGGICQSDLPCAMVHILFQGLCGRPGFVCNPTFDFATNSATLIHCLGSTRMDGPDQPAAPYKLRSIMEREEGAVPQVRMRIGERVTTGILAGTSAMRHFTGQIVDTPDTDRGCRTKITVKLDGDAEKLWQNWTAGIHRVSCYGDLAKELAYFCRFKGITLINEAV